jgi:hypothetical protein
MKRRGLTVARLFILLVAFLSAPVFAGYSPGTASCFEELGAAVTSRAGSQCSSGGCRILSYSPSNAVATVISGSTVYSYTVSVCDSVNSVLPSSAVITPWYGSDPGTVSACGSVVNTVGGVSGSSSGVVQLAGWSMTADEGALIGVSVVSLFAVAAVFKVLSKTGGDSND